ncbi:MAG: hypothetical protein IJL88_14920, partial [Clostridia bacterium]|nr:hypothetical protein [Clostridia bacterium]
RKTAFPCLTPSCSSDMSFKEDTMPGKEQESASRQDPNSQNRPSQQGKTGPERRCLTILFPGLGYTCDKPLLYYSAKLAEKHGFSVRRLNYTDLPANAKKDPTALKTAISCATSQSFAALDQIDWFSYDHILLIAKSIGTQIACAYLDARHLSASAILLTPLEETFRCASGADLAFHGTRDPWAPDSDAIREACRKKGIRLLEYEGANHSLETGNIDLDILHLREIMQEINTLMDTLV